jgi:hypothetical protein
MASTAAPMIAPSPVVQVAPPLICGQAEFDEMEQILRYVLSEAWSKI